MIPRAVLCIAVLLLAFRAEEPVRIGKYKSVNLTKSQLKHLRNFRDIDSYITGSELVVNQDSTFKYTTCGNINEGIWFTRHDSLFLRVKSNRWRNDSLNIHGFNGTWPNLPGKPIGFKIQQDHLEMIHYMEDRKVIEMLKFAP